LKCFKEFRVMSQIGLKTWDRSFPRPCVSGLFAITEYYLVSRNLNGPVDPIPAVHCQAAPSAVVVSGYEATSPVGVKSKVDAGWLTQAPARHSFTRRALQ
jgi:hypothetical protein